MAGFTALICKNEGCLPQVSFRTKNVHGHEKDYRTTTLSGSDYVVEQFTHPKFYNDKVLAEDDDVMIGVEGVLLNLAELKTTTGQSDVFHVVKVLYLQYGKDFVKHLRGDFSGFVYNKQRKQWEVFTNQTGSKRMFYYENQHYVIFASELRDISFLLQALALPYTLNETGAYLLLTYAFMIEENTLITEVKRLMPGCIFTVADSKLELSNYFHLRNIKPTTDSKEQIIETMDALFAKAVRLEFEKDKEYGYKHMATLSGGLDSRMTVLMAHTLGYTDQLNFTFSQSNYLDEQIAKTIASDYQHDFVFHSLDNGNYLKEIDKTAYYNDGQIVYAGAAHVMKCIENINFEKYGLIHTGQIGDAVIGSFLSKPAHIAPDAHSGAYSKGLLSKLDDYLPTVISQYETEELYKFYGRAFMGALNGNFFFDVYSQTVSPFLDIDFLSYCYSIPPAYKYKQQIYLEWMGKKHPEFADYVWEKTGVSPLKSFNYKKYLDVGFYKRMGLKALDRLSGKIKSGMNPFDHWMEVNPSLKESINAYFQSNIHLLSSHSELKNDVEQIFSTGSAGEKFQVLTLLAACKLHGVDASAS